MVNLLHCYLRPGHFCCLVVVGCSRRLPALGHSAVEGWLVPKMWSGSKNLSHRWRFEFKKKKSISTVSQKKQVLRHTLWLLILIVTVWICNFLIVTGSYLPLLVWKSWPAVGAVSGDDAAVSLVGARANQYHTWLSFLHWPSSLVHCGVSSRDALLWKTDSPPS